MNSMTRFNSRALVASLLVLIAACSDGGDGALYSGDLPSALEASPPAPEPSTGNIVEVATAAESFPTLLAAAEAAGLVDALSDHGISLTVFAPTEEAFAALPAGTLDALLADTEALADVLTYHVLDGAVDVDAALNLAPTTLARLEGGNVALTKRDGDYLYVKLSQVIDYDIEASNGVIHVIDSVLLPPDLTPSGMTITEIAQADGSFSTLSGLIEDAGLTDELMDPNANMTIFAPTNDAFGQMKAAGIFTKALSKATSDHLADFTTGSFGDAVVDPETETYTFPTGAQNRAEFANNADIYPLIFGEGGSITLTVSAATPTNIRFSFEYLPYPDEDLAHETEQVPIDSTEPAEYTIGIPTQGENTFSSFLLYIVELDQPVALSNLVVSDDAAPPPEPDAELADLLRYHVYCETAYSDAAIALDGNSIEILNGELMNIAVQMDNLFVNDARVVTADIVSGNGVIHAINKVLSGGPTAVVADFTTGALGGGVASAATETYTFPAGAEGWADFAKNADIYPISLKARLPSPRSYSTGWSEIAPSPFQMSWF